MSRYFRGRGYPKGSGWLVKAGAGFGALTGLLLAWGLSGFFVAVFLLAYTSPSKTVLLGINWFGEANMELVMLPAAFLLETIAVVFIVKLYIVPQLVEVREEEEGLS